MVTEQHIIYLSLQ